jgi:hypothetical protein
MSLIVLVKPAPGEVIGLIREQLWFHLGADGQLVFYP